MKADYYVYLLIDPRNQKPFYVGKGTGKRETEHLMEAKRPEDKWTNPLKCRRINSILSQGYGVIHRRIYEQLTEGQAFSLESELIKLYGRLINNTGILTNIISEDRVNPRKYKKVDQYALDRTFIQTLESMQEAAGIAGVSINTMSGVIHNRISNGKTMRTAGGFLWVLSGEDVPEYDRYTNIYQKKLKPVRQLTLNGELLNVFVSMREASERTGINVAHISCCCKKHSRRKSAGGFKWEFTDTNLA